eukprot:jgi/Tetstr1/434301/TSEL_023407.t2
MSPIAAAFGRGGRRTTEAAVATAAALRNALGAGRGYQGAPPGVRFLPQSTAVTSAPPSQLAEAVARRLDGSDRERKLTAAALARTLKPEDRIFLAHALAEGAEGRQGAATTTACRAARLVMGLVVPGAAGRSGEDGAAEEAAASTSAAGGGEGEGEGGEVPVPSNRALIMLAIMAGESIEASFGALFTMSSMCAAGWGNLISDIAGLSLQEVIAKHSYHIAKEPELTAEQEALPITQRARQAGAMAGISIGCILGMVPLLFLPDASP